MTRLALAASLLLVACTSKEARQTCTKAADQYERCIGELLGPDFKKLAHDKRDIGSCAGEDRTVEMYRTCLPKTSCDEFMSCIEAYAEKHGP